MRETSICTTVFVLLVALETDDLKEELRFGGFCMKHGKAAKVIYEVL
jgi:hypothetical protein